MGQKFKEDLKASWEKHSEGEESAKGPPRVEFEPASVQMNTTKKFSEREREEKGRKSVPAPSPSPCVFSI
jgi:hypothetical protein